jgi:hypothetical protein
MTKKSVYITYMLLVSLLVFVGCNDNNSGVNENVSVISIEKPTDVYEYAKNETLEFSHFSVDDEDKIEITVTNNSDSRLPVALAAYKMFGNSLSELVQHDETQTTIQPGGEQTLKVLLPECMADVELFFDPPDDDTDGAPEELSNADLNLIGWTFHMNNEDIQAENDNFHFGEDHPYASLDDFPEDGDDGHRGAKPAENFCSQ